MVCKGGWVFEWRKMGLDKGFAVFSQFSFYPYNYYSEWYMFDRPIVVKLICYCVEHEPYKSSIFLISMNWWNKVRKQNKNRSTK